MKTNIAIVALFSAAVFLTPAHATTTLLYTTLNATNGLGQICFIVTCTGGPTGSAGTITAYGYTSGLNGTLPPTTQQGQSDSNGAPLPTADQSTVSFAATGTENTGYGIPGGQGDLHASTTGQNAEFDILDFSAPTTYGGGNVTGVTFTLNIDGRPGKTQESYYVLYGITGNSGNGVTNTVTAGTGNTVDLTYLASGDMYNTPTTTTLSTSGLYTGYAIGILGDCSLNITGIDVKYSSPTPEPGTFVMAGIAMLGLGVTMKKRNRKA